MKKLCLHCNKQFIAERSARKYCSRQCSKNAQSFGVNIQTCPTCNRNFEVKNYRTVKRTCCSVACANLLFSKKFTGLGNPNYGNRHPDMYKHTDSEKQKIKNAVLISWKTSNRMNIHLKRREEYKQKFGYYPTESPSARLKISNAAVERMKSKPQYFGYLNCKRGWYFSKKTKINEYYHSSYELKRMMELDDDPLVKSWTKKHNYNIIYEFAGISHKYIPDFFIESVDGSIILEEVKGYVNNIEKFKRQMNAFKMYCKTANIICKLNCMNYNGKLELERIMNE